MRASVDKNRDMARSILPCKNRQPARVAKVKTKRAHRHAIKQELKVAAKLTDLDEWDDRSDLRAEPSGEISQLVRWRRAGDKLRHFERWAIAITANLPPENRLATMRARLPSGLIGDHAMSHLRRHPELNPHPPSNHWRHAWRQRRDERRATVVLADTADP